MFSIKSNSSVKSCKYVLGDQSLSIYLQSLRTIATQQHIAVWCVFVTALHSNDFKRVFHSHFSSQATVIQSVSSPSSCSNLIGTSFIVFPTLKTHYKGTNGVSIDLIKQLNITKQQQSNISVSVMATNLCSVIDSIFDISHQPCIIFHSASNLNTLLCFHMKPALPLEIVRPLTAKCCFSNTS